jgi:AraC family transcriptional regulator
MQTPPIPDNAIAILHHGAFGRVDYLRCNGLAPTPSRSDIATRLHFSLPLVGSFVWHAENEDVFADPTALLCTQPGESYRISHPHGGDESLVLTPSLQALAHLSERAERAGLAGPRRMIVAPARAQMLAYTLYVDPLTSRDAFAADECLLQLFETIAAGASTDRNTHEDVLVRRTLDYVHSTFEPLLTLKNVAAAMGVRATYLTHAFARRVGQPLYRYIIGLKLARALHRVTTTDDDLTHIALDLGYSSHSHLSSVFRARYGVSPSQVRNRLEPPRAEAPASSDARGDSRPLIRWRPLCPARGGSVRNAACIEPVATSPERAGLVPCHERA